MKDLRASPRALDCSAVFGLDASQSWWRAASLTPLWNLRRLLCHIKNQIFLLLTRGPFYFGCSLFFWSLILGCGMSSVSAPPPLRPPFLPGAQSHLSQAGPGLTRSDSRCGYLFDPSLSSPALRPQAEASHSIRPDSVPLDGISPHPSPWHARQLPLPRSPPPPTSPSPTHPHQQQAHLELVTEETVRAREGWGVCVERERDVCVFVREQERVFLNPSLLKPPHSPSSLSCLNPLC